MKFFLILFFTLSISPAIAKVYKCELNGSTSYQQQPCEAKGNEFIIKNDISPGQYEEAVNKLEKELAISAEQQRIAEQDAEKEHLIQAQEEHKERQIEALERQADSLERLETIERQKHTTKLYIPSRDSRRIYSPNTRNPGTFSLPHKNTHIPSNNKPYNRPANSPYLPPNKNVRKIPYNKPITQHKEVTKKMLKRKE